MNSKIWNKPTLYDDFMGKWSTLVARKFLKWLSQDFNLDQKSWIDVGCGTGALSFEIMNSYKPLNILGIDPSYDYLPKSFSSNVSFKIGNSTNLPTNNDFFDLAVSGLALNFMPDKKASIQEMLRVIKPEGVLAIYVWDYSGQMEFLRTFWDAAMKIKPEAKQLDEGLIFPICKKPALYELFKTNGLQDIKLEEIVIQTKFSNFESFWNPFLGGQGPAGQFLSTLSENDRSAIKSLLQNELPIANDQSITLQAKSFAIRGVKS